LTRLNSTFENALIAWVYGSVTGLTAAVWDKQDDAPRPALPYATLNLLPPIKENGAQTETIRTSTKDTFTAIHRYKMNVSVNIISNGDYFLKMQKLEQSLDKAAVLSALKTAGLYFRGMSGAIDLTALLDTSYEFRVQQDFEFAFTADTIEKITEIETVKATFDCGNNIEINIDQSIT